VWLAITDVGRMRQWFFDNIPAFEPEAGFETRFRVESEGRSFMHVWKVTDVRPLKRIVWDWSYAEYDGDAFVSFELTDHGDATVLKVTSTTRRDFPDDIPEFTSESCLAGWRYFIQQRLKAYLDEN